MIASITHTNLTAWKLIKSHEKARQMKKVFCFNNCACRVFRTNLVLVWFQCCPRYFSRKKGISGTFLSLGLRPRLQKIFPRFPFFYFSNLDNTSIRRGQICPQTWQHNYRNKILYLMSLSFLPSFTRTGQNTLQFFTNYQFLNAGPFFDPYSIL